MESFQVGEHGKIWGELHISERVWKLCSSLHLALNISFNQLFLTYTLL